ncbi:hypothetical protein UT300005_02680 [Clostridium sp. CTA-5]
MNLLLHIQVNLISFFILIILIMYSRNKLNRIENIGRIYFTLLILTSFILLCEIFNVFLDYYPIKLFFIHKLINTFSFSLYPVVSYLLYKFIMFWIDKDYKCPVILTKLFFIPILINFIICLINFKFNILFYIDTISYLYIQGKFFLSPFILSSIYFLYTFLYIVINKDKILPIELLIFLKSFIIILMFLAILQINFPNYLILWTFVSIFLALSYLFMQSDLAEKDSLTDTFNKTFFYTYINKLNKSKECNQNLAAIKINLTNLLTVNNRLGHAIGDEMLRNTARLLKKSFLKKGIIIRTDGNEFLVLVHSVDKYELDMLIFNMNKVIYLYNKRSNKPYKIKFKFSYALYNNDFHTFDEFFNYLQIKMYENNSFT